MPIQQDSSAVALARAHAEAWSHHDWEKARSMLASDVQVTATTTLPLMKPTDTTGIDDYMDGLITFAQAVEPGSARDRERRRRAELADPADRTSGVRPGGEKVTLPAARLVLFGENQKLKKEQVVFFMVPD
jgi:hypothetical protein